MKRFKVIEELRRLCKRLGGVDTEASCLLPRFDEITAWRLAEELERLKDDIASSEFFEYSFRPPEKHNFEIRVSPHSISVDYMIEESIAPRGLYEDTKELPDLGGVTAWGSPSMARGVVTIKPREATAEKILDAITLAKGKAIEAKYEVKWRGKE